MVNEPIELITSAEGRKSGDFKRYTKKVVLFIDEDEDKLAVAHLPSPRGTPL